MKTVVLLIVSSIFLSNVPNKKAQDSIDEVLKYKINEKERIKIETIVDSRTPIIIVKRD